MSATPLRHIRIGVVRASKRVAGSRGNPGKTLCGAAITGYDFALPEYQSMHDIDRAYWPVCKSCEFHAGCFCKKCGDRLAYNNSETFCPNLKCKADADIKRSLSADSGICDHCNTEPCECQQENIGEDTDNYPMVASLAPSTPVNPSKCDYMIRQSRGDHFIFTQCPDRAHSVVNGHPRCGRHRTRVAKKKRLVVR